MAAWQRDNGLQPFGICKTCRHFRPEAQEGGPHWCALLQQKLSAADGLTICVEHERHAA